MIQVCTYCGKEANEQMLIKGCCGEVHFKQVEECPECGSTDTYSAHHEGDMRATECNYMNCESCSHQWGHQ